MSLIDEYVCRFDAQLDDLWQHALDKLRHGDISPDSLGYVDPEVDKLYDVIRSLSTTSKSRSLLRLEKLIGVLSHPAPRNGPHTATSETHEAYVWGLSWLVAAKAIMQMLGSMAHIFLERSLVLGDEIAYWEDVRSSSWYTGLYAAQTSPHRIWRKIQAAYLDRERPFSVALVSTGWTEFYNRMQRCFKPQSVYRLRDALPSVLAKSKSEVRQKQKSLEAMKTRYTSCIGFLVQECLTFQIDSGISNSEPYDLTGEQWRNFVLKSAIVIEKIASATGNYTPDFEEETLATIAREADTLESSTQGTYSHLHPDLVIDRLLHILRNSLPNNLTLSKMAINNHRRPSYITRYWIPFAFGFFTANTFMRIWVAQRAKLLSWAMDIGSTTVRFWGNWVVEPIEKLVKTIRHDEGSDIALMSKNSLEADRASLERMVVDFVTDHDPSTGGTTPTNANAVALKVREGDLTPVLRAYERDLRAPFIGTVRGDLIRALLIQIQKTKVDVEVAMSGIDSLLKSQELVFGFVGLTPGILVSYAAFRWAWGVFGNRKGLQLGRKQGEMKYALRDVHRILTSSRTVNGTLSYHDHGQLICGTEALLQKGGLVLNRGDRHEFQKDIQELAQVQQGVDRQLQIVERIRWGYSGEEHRVWL